MTLQERWEKAEEFINGIPRFTQKNTLENTKGWYQKLGCPGAKARIIHVAGTNGKGSVCNYLCHLLMAEGMHVGMFTSPHLIRMNERVSIDARSVDETSFLNAYERMRDVIGSTLSSENGSLQHPTFFEFLFLLAMLVFEEEKAEVIILETGLGGRLDATNIFDRPWMTVITQIGLDHMMYLGETKEQIAGEKAGIIKPGVRLVYADRTEETSRVIKERAAALHAPASPVGEKDVRIEKIKNKSIDFSYKSRYYDYIIFTLPTNALYQAENAALALRANELLMGEAWDIEKCRNVLHTTTWAGRMEEILPDVYVDGAHNEDGIQAFLNSVCRMRDQKRNTLVFSVVRDKACDEMVHSIVKAGVFDRFVVVHMPQERGASQQQLQEIFGAYENLDVLFADTLDDAIETAVRQKKENERVYIAGSLYLVGYVLAILGRKIEDDRL
ncbi:MAG: bifunctional folylpolyglutamate synthase/dihydrofolate synthase [Lachnospiraceae bacterium]|nr:bifunctional folylpolyglutamate synthase/dihydrofolate synthase [Lachnospiraceae bacterium]